MSSDLKDNSKKVVSSMSYEYKVSEGCQEAEVDYVAASVRYLDRNGITCVVYLVCEVVPILSRVFLNYYNS